MLSPFRRTLFPLDFRAALRRASLLLSMGLGLSSAQAGPSDFAIYTQRLGGEPEAAQPYIDRMAAEIEKAAGWAKGSAKGRFLTSRKEVQSFLDAQKPGFGILEPWLYFELRQSQKLELVVQVDSVDLNSPKLHVVVKDPAWKSLADLKDKKLWTHLADSPTYLSQVVLDGKQPAQAHFQLKQVGTALKAARAVLRGEADAALLDDEQLAMAQKLEGGGALRVLYSSTPQPPVAVVAFGGALASDKQAALRKALLSLCAGAGAATCKEMHISKFVAPDNKLFQDAQRRFDGAASAGKSK
jgi:ABC-type phosphate/phosphonate transport system substrate-binding protein